MGHLHLQDNYRDDNGYHAVTECFHSGFVHRSSRCTEDNCPTASMEPGRTRLIRFISKCCAIESARPPPCAPWDLCKTYVRRRYPPTTAGDPTPALRCRSSMSVRAQRA